MILSEANIFAEVGEIFSGAKPARVSDTTVWRPAWLKWGKPPKRKSRRQRFWRSSLPSRLSNSWRAMSCWSVSKIAST